MEPSPESNETYDLQEHVEIVESLCREVEAATLALSKNRIAEFCACVAAQEILCRNLDKLLDTYPSGQSVAVSGVTPSQLLTMQAAHQRLAVRSRLMAGLLRRCQRSFSLLERHYRACVPSLGGCAWLPRTCRFSTEV